MAREAQHLAIGRGGMTHQEDEILAESTTIER